MVYSGLMIMCCMHMMRLTVRLHAVSAAANCSNGFVIRSVSTHMPGHRLPRLERPWVARRACWGSRAGRQAAPRSWACGGRTCGHDLDRLGASRKLVTQKTHSSEQWSAIYNPIWLCKISSSCTPGRRAGALGLPSATSCTGESSFPSTATIIACGVQLSSRRALDMHRDGPHSDT